MFLTNFFHVSRFFIRKKKREVLEPVLINDDKTEFLLVGTRKQLTKVSIDAVRVGDYNISPSPSVRNLGTWFDPHLDMDVHITKTCSSAFYYLYNIRHIRKYLSRSSPKHSFMCL